MPKEMRKDVEFLENRQQIEEFMFLGLRKTYGVSKKNFTVPLDGNSKMCMDRP